MWLSKPSDCRERRAAILRTDLHVHTHFSDDGDYAPNHILSLAAERGIDTLAFCDHDSVKTYEKPSTRRHHSVSIVVGVELCSVWINMEAHSLAYGFDPQGSPMQTLLRTLKSHRRQQTKKRLLCLQSAGFKLGRANLNGKRPAKTLTTLLQENPGNSRLAKYLPAENPDWESFYQDYLAPGCPAHVPITGLSPHHLVDIIKQLGAVSVLAHPGALLKFSSNKQIISLIGSLARNGLVGIEAYTSWHSHSQASEFTKLANNLGLAVTVGSDFHGPICKPEVQLGDPEEVPPCVHQMARNIAL